MKSIANVAIVASVVVVVWCFYGTAADQAPVPSKDADTPLIDRIAAPEANAEADREVIARLSKELPALKSQDEAATKNHERRLVTMADEYMRSRPYVIDLPQSPLLDGKNQHVCACARV